MIKNVKAEVLGEKDVTTFFNDISMDMEFETSSIPLPYEDIMANATQLAETVKPAWKNKWLVFFAQAIGYNGFKKNQQEIVVSFKSNGKSYSVDIRPFIIALDSNKAMAQGNLKLPTPSRLWRAMVVLKKLPTKPSGSYIRKYFPSITCYRDYYLTETPDAIILGAYMVYEKLAAEERKTELKYRQSFWRRIVASKAPVSTATYPEGNTYASIQKYFSGN
jgi:hypothetical protein